MLNLKKSKKLDKLLNEVFSLFEDNVFLEDFWEVLEKHDFKDEWWWQDNCDNLGWALTTFKDLAKQKKDIIDLDNGSHFFFGTIQEVEKKLKQIKNEAKRQMKLQAFK